MIIKVLCDDKTTKIWLDKLNIVYFLDKIGFRNFSMLSLEESLPGDNIRINCYLPNLEDLPYDIQISFWLNNEIKAELIEHISNGKSIVKIDSHGKIELKDESGKIITLFYLINENKQLAGFVCHFNGINLNEAEKTAYLYINKILSEISFEHRVPLHFNRVEIFKKQEEGKFEPNYYLIVDKPFLETKIEDLTFLKEKPAILKQSLSWFRSISFYRESLLLIHLPMYRYLALYKGIEDLRLTQSDIAKCFKEKQIPVKFLKMLIPEKGTLVNQYFPELSGKDISEGEKQLESFYRNLVAHNVLKDGKCMTSDNKIGLVNYSNLCTLADLIFRTKANSITEAAVKLENT